MLASKVQLRYVATSRIWIGENESLPAGRFLMAEVQADRAAHHEPSGHIH